MPAARVDESIEIQVGLERPVFAGSAVESEKQDIDRRKRFAPGQVRSGRGKRCEIALMRRLRRDTAFEKALNFVLRELTPRRIDRQHLMPRLPQRTAGLDPAGNRYIALFARPPENDGHPQF